MGRVKRALMSATMDDQYDPELQAAGRAMLATTPSEPMQPSELTQYKNDPRDTMTRAEWVEIETMNMTDDELRAELKRRGQK